MIKFDHLQIVVVNVAAHEGFVANKLKGTDRWEFKRRYGKNKRTLIFEEVERMWTDGRRGRILLDRIPGTEASNVQLDVIEGRGIMLSQTATLRKMDDFFIVSFGQSGSYNFPYEFVRAVWPASGGGWHVSLTVKFELNMMGEVRTYYESR